MNFVKFYFIFSNLLYKLINYSSEARTIDYNYRVYIN